MKFLEKTIAAAIVIGAMSAGAAQATTVSQTIQSGSSSLMQYTQTSGGSQSSSGQSSWQGGSQSSGSWQGSWQGGGQSGGTPSAVPVPASLPLFLGGMALLGVIGARRRNQKAV